MKNVAKELKKILADTYALYLKTQNYHWNVEGTNFKTLHLLFEEQYKELAIAIDSIAELIRMLGEKAPGTFHDYSKSNIKDGDENLTDVEMIKDLLSDHITIQKTLQDGLEISKNSNNEVVSGFIVERLTFHTKIVWILKSSL